MASDFVDAVARFIDRHQLVPDGAPVLVGVSGGPDSMVCLALLRELGYEVRALHVNYGLREGADADEALVRDWCADHSPPIPLRVEHADAAARADGRDESLQEAARVLRYDALANHAAEMGAAAAAVGHHRDDQAETLLLNLFRGAGPEGLAGMRPSRPVREGSDIPLIRPLLEQSRSEVEAYAEARAIPWNDDPSNRDPAYERATIRTEVMPLLQEKFPHAPTALSRTAALLREYVDQTVTPALEDRLDDCYVSCEAGGQLLLEPLQEEPVVWRRRLILAALERTLPEAPRTAAFAGEVADLIDAQVGRRVEVKGGAVWREREGLRFLPAGATPEEVWPPIPVPWGEDVPLPGGVLRIDPLEERPESLEAETPYVEYVDSDRLVDPLDIRTWRDGDCFQPLGLDGTKLVSDFLTDADVPSHQRSGIYVLSTDEHVAWVVGHRLDHRIRVRPSTEQVARLSWDPSDS